MSAPAAVTNAVHSSLIAVDLIVKFVYMSALLCIKRVCNPSDLQFTRAIAPLH